ncbi:MAG: (d)CMP kinase [Zetaproteobacteria bacterium]|nr:(d)CMP kinase [Zetaproteobacteria bacterium]
MNQKKDTFVIAVDGPSGSGKSSLCRETARRLGMTHINTGSYYRVIAWQISLRPGFSWTQEEVQSVCHEIEEKFHWDSTTGNPLWEGQICLKQLNSERMGKLASQAAQNTHVRQALKEVFRRHGCMDPHGTIMEGRDIGTEIFPGAALKIYVDLSAKVRAERRFRDEYPHLEGNPDNYPLELESLLTKIEQRDMRDSERDVAPLIKAEDALLFQNDKPFRESAANLVEIIKSSLSKK